MTDFHPLRLPLLTLPLSVRLSPRCTLPPLTRLWGRSGISVSFNYGGWASDVSRARPLLRRGDRGSGTRAAPGPPTSTSHTGDVLRPLSNQTFRRPLWCLFASKLKLSLAASKYVYSHFVRGFGFGRFRELALGSRAQWWDRDININRLSLAQQDESPHVELNYYLYGAELWYHFICRSSRLNKDIICRNISICK